MFRLGVENIAWLNEGLLYNCRGAEKTPKYVLFDEETVWVAGAGGHSLLVVAAWGGAQAEIGGKSRSLVLSSGHRGHRSSRRKPGWPPQAAAPCWSSVHCYCYCFYVYFLCWY